MARTFYGYWTCAYCGRESRGDVAVCPGCGKTRSKDVKFYPTPKGDSRPREYVDRPAGSTPDWHCSYCDSLNPADRTECANCGHTRDDSDKHYFELHPEREGIKQLDEFDRDSAAPSPQPSAAPAPERSAGPSPAKRLIAVALIAAVLIGLFTVVFAPKKRDLTIDDKQWQREVTIEEYRTVQEEDWVIPAGGRMTGSYQAIHHYNQVLDHYETVTRSRQVADGGHEEVIGYSDNGDGTFSERTRWVTDYRTEYYTEQQPVYVSVPVYQTRYKYDIERWKFSHYETTSGHDDEPYYADPDLSEKFRKNGNSERYWVTATYTPKRGEAVTRDYTVTRADWDRLTIGQSVNAKVHNDGRLELLDE